MPPGQQYLLFGESNVAAEPSVQTSVWEAVQLPLPLPAAAAQTVVPVAGAAVAVGPGEALHDAGRPACFALHCAMY